MKKFYFLFAFVILSVFEVSAQNLDIKRTWHWYFGYWGGLNFSTGQAVADTTGRLSADEACASISDQNGNLQFYTNGFYAWNRNNNTMPNGTDLSGHPSTTQCLIVPNPANSNQNYIFTNDMQANIMGGGCGCFAYTLVDMTLDSGLGDVVPSQKNVELFSVSTEKVAGTAHANKTDWWVAAHEWESNCFYVYKVGATGIELNPIISCVGYSHYGSGANTIINFNSIGQMQFSPDGNKLSVCRHGSDTIEVFQFNKSTGVISNPCSINLQASISDAYGISFSSNSRYLYVISSTAIFQIDTSIPDSAFMQNSKTTIAGGIDYGENGLQLGPDGNIYIFGNYLKYLSRITNPNLAFPNCQVIVNSTPLQFTANENVYLSGIGSPNFISSFLLPNSSAVNENTNNEDEINVEYLYNQVKITSKSNINTISIFNLSGVKLIEVNPVNNTTYLLNYTLPKGVYILTIQTTQKSFVKKFVIVN